MGRWENPHVGHGQGQACLIRVDRHVFRPMVGEYPFNVRQKANAPYIACKDTQPQQPLDHVADQVRGDVRIHNPYQEERQQEEHRHAQGQGNRQGSGQRPRRYLLLPA